MIQKEISMPEDFMPIQNFDYLEFYVGDAKQSAYYFSNAWGFTPIAYAGLETGVRDHSSYVLEGQYPPGYHISTRAGRSDGGEHQTPRRRRQSDCAARRRRRAGVPRSNLPRRAWRDGADQPER